MDPTRARPVPFCFQSFLPRSGDLIAALGRGGSLTQSGAIVLDRLPKQRVVDLARKDFVGEFEFSNFLSSEIDYIDVCHRSSLFVLTIDVESLDFVRLRFPVCSPRSL